MFLVFNCVCLISVFYPWRLSLFDIHCSVTTLLLCIVTWTSVAHCLLNLLYALTAASRSVNRFVWPLCKFCCRWSFIILPCLFTVVFMRWLFLIIVAYDVHSRNVCVLGGVYGNYFWADQNFNQAPWLSFSAIIHISQMSEFSCVVWGWNYCSM